MHCGILKITIKVNMLESLGPCKIRVIGMISAWGNVRSKGVLGPPPKPILNRLFNTMTVPKHMTAWAKHCGG